MDPESTQKGKLGLMHTDEFGCTQGIWMVHRNRVVPQARLAHDVGAGHTVLLQITFQ